MSKVVHFVSACTLASAFGLAWIAGTAGAQQAERGPGSSPDNNSVATPSPGSGDSPGDRPGAEQEAGADRDPAPDQTPSASTRPDLDRETLLQMTREERRAAMRAFKERRADDAAKAGISVTSDRNLVRLDPPRKSFEGPSRAPGTNITYDSGTVLGTTGVGSQMLGNRFDMALNPPGTACCFPVESSGSITMITFDMVNTSGSMAIFSIYSNIMGTTAMQVTSIARTVMTGLNTLSVMSPTTANAYMNGSFLAGIWQFDASSTGLAVDTGTVGGQGFHAISLNDGATGTMLTTVTTGSGMGLNAIFRVSGNVATPVELMSFSIED